MINNLETITNTDVEAVITSAEEKVMPFQETLSYEDVASRLGYDPLTGQFAWLVDVGRNVKAGTIAGSVKATRTNAEGVAVSYRYIRLLGRTIPAARLAWLLQRGVWPAGRVVPRNGDTLDLRFDNLTETNAVQGFYDHADQEARKEYHRAHRKENPLAWRTSQLAAKYNISLDAYLRMIAAQNNKCACCNQPEIAVRNGEIKALAVDHNHLTGIVRELLCQACNQVVGFSKEDPARLRAAADYIEKHRVADNVVPLKKDEAS